MPTNTADIRQYLTSSYSDEELITLCADYFRDVYDNFAVGMTKTAKIQLLLDHCQRRELMPNLLAALERDRPEQYRKRFGQAVVEPGPAAAPPRPRSPPGVHQPRARGCRVRPSAGGRLADARLARLDRAGQHPAGEKWVDAINRGLEECGVFLVVLTPSAVASKWVTDETNAAKEMHQEGELRFIPLGVVDCRVPPLWRVHQRIPFKQDTYPTGLAALLTELESASGQPEAQRPAAPVAEAQTAQPATARDVPSTVTQAPAAQPAAPKTAPDVPRRLEPSRDLLTIRTPIHLELVRVPAGEFLMGSDPKVDKDASADEQPQHRLYLPEFYIGKYPVTNEQYAAFVKTSRQAYS